MILSSVNIDNIETWLEVAATDGGAALLDTDLAWTPFDVVAKGRGMARMKKVVHAGTLEPLATGLLILCFGKWTKKIDEFQGMSKSYTATFRLGATTPSYEAEFEEENIREISNIQFEEIENAVKSFIGEIEQTPPIYSARKVKGKALYKYARDGKTVPEIKSRSVEFYKLDILSYSAPFLEIEIECSKGAYIRSLARDIGEKLGCGAYMSKLRRTAIGEYKVESALRIEQVKEKLTTQSEK